MDGRQAASKGYCMQGTGLEGHALANTQDAMSLPFDSLYRALVPKNWEPFLGH